MSENAGLGAIYTTAVFQNLKPLFAHWEPGQYIALGDYGTLDGAQFNRRGSISDFGIQFQTVGVQRDQHRKFATAGVSASSIAAQAQVTTGAPAVDAGVKISFKDENSVFFNVAGCTTKTIENREVLGAEIRRRHDLGSEFWRREWVVVTDLVNSTRATILISANSGASIVLNAQSNVPRVDLADASLKLTVQDSQFLAYEVVAKEGLFPLIGLWGLKRRRLFSLEFSPVNQRRGDAGTNIEPFDPGQPPLEFVDVGGNPTPETYE